MKRVILFLFLIIVPMSVRAMADYEKPVYGRPTLYGEYELTSADVLRARTMYGDASRRAAPIRDAAPVKKKAAAKHPVKPKAAARGAKKIAQQKASKKPAKTGEKAIVPEDKIVVAENVPALVQVATEDSPAVVTAKKTPRPAPVADKSATRIAGQLQYKLDTDSYCTSRGRGTGDNLPAGIILMPGRPDLMSCVEK